MHVRHCKEGNMAVLGIGYLADPAKYQRPQHGGTGIEPLVLLKWLNLIFSKKCGPDLYQRHSAFDKGPLSKAFCL